MFHTTYPNDLSYPNHCDVPSSPVPADALVVKPAVNVHRDIREEICIALLVAAGARRVTEGMNRWFNKAAEYQGTESAWCYVIFLKTRELAHHPHREEAGA